MGATVSRAEAQAAPASGGCPVPDHVKKAYAVCLACLRAPLLAAENYEYFGRIMVPWR